jgi:hypothetical protein
MVNVGASLGLEFRNSRFGETNLQLDTYYRERLNGAEATTNIYQALAQQWASAAILSHSESLSPTRRINTSLREAYTRVASQPDTFTTQALVGVTETLTRFNSIVFDIGATYVNRTGRAPGQTSPGVLPTANIRWTGTLFNERDRQIHADAMSGYVWAFDPITGLGATRVPVVFNIECILGNHLRVAANLAYVTLISESTTSTSSFSSTNGTMFTAALPIIYRWREIFSIESGVRMSLRGPRMASPSELSGLELWGYVAITANTRYRLN